MKNILLILLTALSIQIWGCACKTDEHKPESEPEQIYFPNDLFGISLGSSYDSVRQVLDANNFDSSVGTDIGSGFSVCVNSKIPFQNTFFERAYIFMCQKHGVIEIVGVKQYDDYESAERCYNAFSDTITKSYGYYHSEDTLFEGIVRQSIFRRNNVKLSLEIQESKRIIDVWPLIEADSWNVNVRLCDELCKDI